MIPHDFLNVHHMTIKSGDARRNPVAMAATFDGVDIDDAVEIPASGEDLENMSLLMQAVYQRTGMDFRDYSTGSLFRRVKRRMMEEGVATIDSLRDKALDDSECMDRLLGTLTLPVTAMFRDPSFFLAFRERVCPLLATYPFLRLWIAGCSTGEEAYSIAIVLTEMGLYERSRIYATDLHPALLQQAESGIYRLSLMQEYTRNYHAAGGARAFTDYYVADSEYAALRPDLRKNIVFATHNLTCDGSFNEFQVVLCRNVMIYFNDRLQARVHRLLYESLSVLGYLSLGRSESIRFSHHENNYEPVSKVERIYRKVR